MVGGKGPRKRSYPDACLGETTYREHTAMVTQKRRKGEEVGEKE